jgi:hypothetical protein
VRFYDLDNEPDIWFATHRDVHPVGPGYDEMLSKTESIALGRDRPEHGGILLLL